MVSLYALKMREFYELLSSLHDNDNCINHDSVFNIMRANKNIFEDKDPTLNSYKAEI